MHLEVVGDLACRVPVQAHQDPLDPQEHPRLFVTLGLLAESQQLGNGGLPAVRKRWAHIAIIAHFTNDVELFMRTYIALPDGALTFLNARIADYLRLPKDHPQRFGTDTGADWDSNLAFLHADDREENTQSPVGMFTHRLRR